MSLINVSGSSVNMFVSFSDFQRLYHFLIFVAFLKGEASISRFIFFTKIPLFSLISFLIISLIEDLKIDNTRTTYLWIFFILPV